MGIRVDDPERIADAWDKAFASDRPTVVEAITDPDVPTLPPHISLEEAKNFMASILKGDSESPGIIKQAVKGMVQSMLPHA